jgi:hypothetical protein
MEHIRTLFLFVLFVPAARRIWKTEGSLFFCSLRSASCSAFQAGAPLSVFFCFFLRSLRGRLAFRLCSCLLCALFALHKKRAPAAAPRPLHKRRKGGSASSSRVFAAEQTKATQPEAPAAISFATSVGFCSSSSLLLLLILALPLLSGCRRLLSLPLSFYSARAFSLFLLREFTARTRSSRRLDLPFLSSSPCVLLLTFSLQIALCSQKPTRAETFFFDLEVTAAALQADSLLHRGCRLSESQMDRRMQTLDACELVGVPPLWRQKAAKGLVKCCCGEIVEA